MINSIINKEIFNIYPCVGIFSFKDKEFKAKFDLIQYIDGKVEIIVGGFFVLLLMERYSNQDDYCSISAKVSNQSLNVFVEEAIISNVSFNVGNNKPTYAILNIYKSVIIQSDEKLSYNKVFVYLTNFLNNFTKKGSFQEFNLENNGYLINFEGLNYYSDYTILLYERKEDSIITSIAKIDMKNQNLDIIAEMDKLTYLLSYSNRTHISPVCFNFYDGKQLVKTILYPVLTTRFSNQEKLIEPNNIKYFLEKCYSHFLKNYHDFSLNIVINIYLESLLSNYVDSSYVLLVSALESFLLAHENQCRNNGESINPSSINRIKKEITNFFNEQEYDISDDELEELSEKLAYNNTTLIEKLSLLKNKEKFKSNLNLKSEDYDFPTIRNKIIHTGNVPKDINSSGKKREINMVEEYARTLFLLDKIILSLLEYDGLFNDFLNKKEISFIDEK